MKSEIVSKNFLWKNTDIEGCPPWTAKAPENGWERKTKTILSFLGFGLFLGGRTVSFKVLSLSSTKKNTPDSSSLAVQTVALQVFGMFLQLRWHQLVRRDLGPRSLSLKTINGLSIWKQPRLFVCRFGLLVWVFLTNLDLHHFLDVFLKNVFKKKELQTWHDHQDWLIIKIQFFGGFPCPIFKKKP